MMLTSDVMDVEALSEWVLDARTRTLQLVEDLADEQFIVPQMETVNPFIWEVGHVAWFQEKWVLRHVGGHEPLHQEADRWFDSIAIAHDSRWQLDLPLRRSVLKYAHDIGSRVRQRLHDGPVSDDLMYAVKLSVFHEDMHAEAFTYMRQTLGYQAPRFFQTRTISNSPQATNESRGDIDVAGQTMFLGADPQEPFVFDNEKCQHAVDVKPFSISAEAVTQAEFAEFVDAGGYRHREFWDDQGWAWRDHIGVDHPVYWIRGDDGGWTRRHFDHVVSLEPQHPIVHVNWYEAQAWCRWAGRRLPTEAEWELAAAGQPEPQNTSSTTKRRYPWGAEPATTERANVDWRSPCTLAVSALPDGDSAFGCRQMLGNVWEWTSSPFLPYPGFTPDWYQEYSQPWFNTHRVLRGGCWATRARLLRNTFRNYFSPERSDIFAGFRTCKK